MKNILLLKSANIPVEICCPVITINKDEFLKVQDWAMKMNFKFYTDFSIIGTQDLSGSNLKYRLSIEEETKFQAKLYERSPWEKKTFKSPSSSDKIYSENLDTLAISAEGNYIPNVLRADKILGNIWDNKLDDIWIHSEFLNILRELEYSQFPACLNCDAVEYCEKCYDVHYFETGNFFKQSKRLCESVKLTNQIVNYFQP
jgi:radical SAM protein with 4Fe4S-binding SPASM domain